VSNLFAGCACCTVSGEFTDAARKIRDELDPEWLVVETTGIAYPAAMRENLASALNAASRLIVIADAKRWTRLFAAMNALISGQLVGAETVLINKCDLADDETLAKIEEDIRGMEPRSKIFRVSAKAGIADEIWQFAAGMGE
jgi:G3E family GTPase